MRIISFLAKLWSAIKRRWKDLPADVQLAVHTGVVVTENLKKFAESPVADVLTAIIPGDIDDKIKLALRAALPVLLVKLRLLEFVPANADAQALTFYAAKALSELDPEIRPATLHSLSVLLTQVAADGKLSWSDAVAIVEWYYKNKFKSDGK